jgi:hypothetical protein
MLPLLLLPLLLPLLLLLPPPPPLLLLPLLLLSPLLQLLLPPPLLPLLLYLCAALACYDPRECCCCKFLLGRARCEAFWLLTAVVLSGISLCCSLGPCLCCCFTRPASSRLPSFPRRGGGGGRGDGGGMVWWWWLCSRCSCQVTSTSSYFTSPAALGAAARSVRVVINAHVRRQLCLGSERSWCCCEVGFGGGAFRIVESYRRDHHSPPCQP